MIHIKYMGIKPTVNEYYKQLCTELGDVETKLQRIQARKSEILAEIDALNKALPQLEALEWYNEKANKEESGEQGRGT